MNDRSHTGNGEVGLQVLVMVPTEGGDPVSLTDAQVLKGYSQSFCASGKIPVSVPMDTLVGKATDNLFVSKLGFGPSQNGRKGQLVFHH